MVEDSKNEIRREVGKHIVRFIEDLQERYDCVIYLDRDDIELHGSDEFYEQLIKNITKYRFEWA